MRLIRIHADGSLSFEEFFNEELPKYAILSHRWGSNETTYKDFKHGRGHQTTKLKGCADQAHRDGHEYMWIDTCCINKSSSAELTEAINSMYAWYAKSEVCYAYLNDIHGHDFSKSRWLERGWTLQELIAPQEVHFFDANWQAIGTKDERKEELRWLTNIPKTVLEGWSPLSFSVAERMHWASRRVTTRIEDEAYCLMGIFDVNMPLLYGEGRKAFRRLQEEIIRKTGDCTTLAWSLESDKFYHSSLASSPSAFKTAKGLFACLTFRSPVVENISLRADVLLKPVKDQSGLFEATLGCFRGHFTTLVSILLLELTPRIQVGRWQKTVRSFVRVRPDLINLRGSSTLSTDLAKVENVSILSTAPHGIYKLRPDLDIVISAGGLKAVDVWTNGLLIPARTDDPVSSVITFVAAASGVAAAFLYDTGRTKRIVVIGFNTYGRPWCQLAEAKGQTLKDAVDWFTHEEDEDWPSEIRDDAIMVKTRLESIAGRIELRVGTQLSPQKPHMKVNRLRDRRASRVENKKRAGRRLAQRSPTIP